MRTALLALAAVITLGLAGCAGLKVNTQATTDCMVQCLNEPILVTKENGDTITVKPSDYKDIIFSTENPGQIELKGKK